MGFYRAHAQVPVYPHRLCTSEPKYSGSIFPAGNKPEPGSQRPMKVIVGMGCCPDSASVPLHPDGYTEYATIECLCARASVHPMFDGVISTGPRSPPAPGIDERIYGVHLGIIVRVIKVYLGCRDTVTYVQSTVVRERKKERYGR